MAVLPGREVFPHVLSLFFELRVMLSQHPRLGFSRMAWGSIGFETGTLPPKLVCQKTAKRDISPESVKETFFYVALKDCHSGRCPDKTPLGIERDDR